MADSKTLVIVESPAKGKTIEKYLGDGYQVLASVGHVRDLVSPRDLPADMKKGPFGKFAVDIEHGFEPYYVVNDDKKKTVAELKRALKDADELILATDEDREGEAIAWHLLEVLKPKVPVKRMVFHEITKDAIEHAKQNTRELDTALVDAQETRRILDRLYGYEVSPVLWRKVRQGLSAGRVQSPTTRLVVDRERERMAFVSAPYWSVTASFDAKGQAFQARLARLAGTRIATGSDFDDRGAMKADRVALDEAATGALVTELERSTFAVTSVESKPYRRRPSAPFTTSTLQQESGRKLRFSAKQTMSVAQSLYENGYITYMRTDSASLSGQAISAARTQASKLYGTESVPDKPRAYAGKSKNAQEAHEAIRPAGDEFRTPSSLKSSLTPNEQKLYDLIWKRTVASQMIDATGSTATITIASGETSRGVAEFTASGTVITEPGFLQAYEEGTDESRYATDDEQSKLPNVSQGEGVDLAALDSSDHVTSPPPRYTEASLVKALEELGIGRPSTYASIIDTIIRRGFVSQRGSALVPEWIAFSTMNLLEEHLGDFVEYDFTASMEDDLDRIADGKQDRVEWLTGFWNGRDGRRGLHETVDGLGEIDARAVNSIPVAEGVMLRVGQYGPYLEGQDEAGNVKRANVPEELAPDELTEALALELFNAPPKEERVLGQHPETGKDIIVRDGRYGPFVQEVEPPVIDEATGEVVVPKKGKNAPKPRTASLFKAMDIEAVDLETALQLLSLPRVIGVDPESGVEISARPGRYGPFITKGDDTRSLETEEQIFSLTLDEAVERFAQPKYGARRASSSLKEFEADPVSGKPIKVKDGRFGPYATDGETNATIPRGEDVEAITFERAVELLQIKRDKGPAKKPARKPAAKKPAAKKPAAKKPAAKKPAAKKPAAKKPAAKKATGE